MLWFAIKHTPPEKSNPRYGRFYFCVGVAVWTNRSQSVTAGFGAWTMPYVDLHRYNTQ